MEKTITTYINRVSPMIEKAFGYVVHTNDGVFNASPSVFNEDEWEIGKVILVPAKITVQKVPGFKKSHITKVTVRANY